MRRIPALTTLFLEASVCLIQLLESSVYLIQLLDQFLFAAEVSRTPKLYAPVPGGVQGAPNNTPSND